MTCWNLICLFAGVFQTSTNRNCVFVVNSGKKFWNFQYLKGENDIDSQKSFRYVCIIICDMYFLLSFKKMDKLVMMINQGINEVIADGFARDRGQRLSQVQIQAQTSITFVTIKTPQLGYNLFINR